MAAWYNSGNWDGLKKQEWIYPFAQLMYTLNEWEKVFLLGKHTDPWSLCSLTANFASSHGTVLECPMTKWTDKNGDSITSPAAADFDGMLINGPEFVGNLERMLARIPKLWAGTPTAVYWSGLSTPNGFPEGVTFKSMPWPAIIPIDNSATAWANESAFIATGGYGSSLVLLTTFDDCSAFLQAKGMLDAMEAIGHQVWICDLDAISSTTEWWGGSFADGWNRYYAGTPDERWAAVLATAPNFFWQAGSYVPILWREAPIAYVQAQTNVKPVFYGSLMRGEQEGSVFYVERRATNTDIALTFDLPDGTTVTVPATPYGSSYESDNYYDCGSSWLTVGSDYEWDTNDNTSPAASPIDNESVYSFNAEARIYRGDMAINQYNIQNAVDGALGPRIFLDLTDVEIDHEAP